MLYLLLEKSIENLQFVLILKELENEICIGFILHYTGYKSMTYFIDVKRAMITRALIKADIVSPMIKGTSLQDVSSET